MVPLELAAGVGFLVEVLDGRNVLIQLAGQRHRNVVGATRPSGGVQDLDVHRLYRHVTSQLGWRSWSERAYLPWRAQCRAGSP